MKKVLLITFLLTTVVFPHLTWADSPLTSTAISEAYQDVKIVKKAIKSKGLLNKKLMKYLANPKKPIDVKIALVNELGWVLDGKDNASIFWKYLQKKHDYEDRKDFLAKADGELMICMAYVKALDNYQNVTEALSYARRAKSKNKVSYTVNIVCALIEAQKAFDRDWCKTYQITNEVRTNAVLQKDMKEEAIQIIFDYMDLYKEYC